jgi:hypothetical protein
VKTAIGILPRSWWTRPLQCPRADLIGDKPDEFQAFINAELQRYAKVAKEANMELQ